MSRLEADWLKSAATQRVFSLLSDAGFQVFAVGGCVRDALLGKGVSDIDISTDAQPGTVETLAKEAGLRTVPTGIDHGTVTVLVGDAPYEITTFRQDVETDGRRAVVAFSDRVEDDALRRDFTMNALYCGADGTILDPLGGLDDLHAGRVRFIEDAETRIREDYLRSLRYFRFHAWYGDLAEGMDAEALAAIAANVEGLAGLSRERVGSEVKRLLGAPDPAPAVAGMRATGVLAQILPGADDRFLAPLIAVEEAARVGPGAMRRLAVLGGAEVAERLRLSRREAQALEDIAAGMALAPGELGYRQGAEAGRDALLVAAAIRGEAVSDAALEDMAHGAEQVFPLKAGDLMPALEGPALGQALKRLEAEWIASGFTLDRDALLARRG